MTRLRPNRIVTCAATTCMVPVARGHLMCRAHWLGLPQRLRHAILATFRAGHSSNYQELVSEAVDLADAMPAPFESRDQARRRADDAAFGIRDLTAIDSSGRTVRWTDGRML